MPKSKPPRRRYRPLRRIDKFDERTMTFYDKLEEASAKLQERAAPFLDQIPAKERAHFLAKQAEIRATIAEGRKDILAPDPTPVLDRLLHEDAERRRKARLTPPASPVFSAPFG